MPYTRLLALFLFCSWEISKHSRRTCVQKEGGFYFKEEKVPCLWLCGLKWTTTKVYQGPVTLSVKREEEEANVGLFPPCSVQGELTCG